MRHRLGARWVAACFAAGALAMLAACAAPEAPPVGISITFQHREPIRLDAAKVEIVDAYEAPARAPHIEHFYDETPANIARRWAAERLVPEGTRGQVTLIIEDASVVTEDLPVKAGVEGWFTTERDTRLKARLKARLEYVDVSGGLTAYAADVEAVADRTTLESYTVNERDLAYYKTLEALAEAFDTALDGEVRRVMAPIIR